MQRRIVNARRGEETAVESVAPDGRVIRSDVGRVRGDRNGRGERDLLPARRRLSRERNFRQLRAIACPQVADVRAGVLAAFVEAQARDVTVAVRAELHSDFDCAAVVR